MKDIAIVVLAVTGGSLAAGAIGKQAEKVDTYSNFSGDTKSAINIGLTAGTSILFYALLRGATK